MNIRALETKVRQQPIFSTEQLRAYFPDRSIASLRQNLYNWQKQGYVVKLKKSLYAVASRLPEPAKTANLLYEPSYVSLQYALSYYQLIPDAAFQVTSVTTRKTKTFTNATGTYWYRNIKPELYFGYRLVDGFYLADPEKALLDQLYLSKSQLRLDEEYCAELRLQNLDTLDLARLEGYLNRFNVPRLTAFWRYCADHYQL